MAWCMTCDLEIPFDADGKVSNGVVKIKTHVEEKESNMSKVDESESMSEPRKSDEWLDKHGLMTKYAEKTKHHAHRSVTLHQNAKIKTRRSTRHKHKTTFEANLSTEQKLKKQPKMISEATKKRLEKNI
ncbi:unnamed protein product [Prorocentrum cordatum]|uniref:Uncharacterized protein n=1 Tax=Prorocentrum cordatum TaxID=2364126 RepID=A0ABN9UJW9_9DINO|nr:unnamed protein product [Polarella glacialis]